MGDGFVSDESKFNVSNADGRKRVYTGDAVSATLIDVCMSRIGGVGQRDDLGSCQR